MAKKKTKRTPGKKVIRKSSVRKAVKKPTSSGGAPRGNAEVKRAVELMEWVHTITGKLCAGFAEDQVLAQPTSTENHLMWQIGHMATGYAWFASMLDGKPATLGEMYDKLFGYGSKPTGDASMYPAQAEVRRIHDEQYQRLLRVVKAMSDADGLKPTVTNSGGFAKNRLDCFYKCIWHEGWHQGQLSALRRVLGLPGVM